MNDCVIHTKILDPFGHYIILKAAINDKIYILINDMDITLFFSNLLRAMQNENLDEEENTSFTISRLVLLKTATLVKQFDQFSILWS